MIRHDWGKNQWPWKYANCNFPNEKQKKKQQHEEIEDNIQKWWESKQRCKICIIGVTEEKEKGTEEKIKIIMIESP